MKVKRKYEFKPDFAVPPGRTLADVRDHLGLCDSELCDIAGLNALELGGILLSSDPITDEIAEKLAKATVVPARIWRNLERQYRDGLARGKVANGKGVDN